MQRNQLGMISIYVIVFALVITGVAALAVTRINQDKTNQTATGENTGPIKETNSTQENAEIEYRAVIEGDADQCARISGESVALGERDQETDYPEDAAKKRCQEAAASGQFLSPRIEHLLKNHAGIELLRECPDEWIENRMPRSVGDNEPNQYFIVQGERREVSDYDLDWVKDNCQVEPQPVH